MSHSRHTDRRFLAATVVAIGLAVLLACSSAVAPLPKVSFVLDGPLCGGGKVSVQFSIDGVLVGSDSLQLFAAGRPGTTSQSFTTTVGRHVIGARTTYGLIWPDSSVTLQTGQTLTDTLPFYCS